MAKKIKSVNRVSSKIGNGMDPLSPSSSNGTYDPGDETQRRYRYQHAYGAILLCAIANGKLPYQSIWCEHHDDYLGQDEDTFGSFQVKTRLPEQGYWQLNTEGFIAAIQKFSVLQTRFPGKFKRFTFVSNTLACNSAAKAKITRAPRQLWSAIHKAQTVSDLTAQFKTSLSTLARKCDSTIECLFQIFKILEFVTGPSLSDFEVVVSQTHIGSLSGCTGLPLDQLNAIRDELIQKVFDASSNRVDDPAKHWCCVNSDPSKDPRILAKRLAPGIVGDLIQAKSPPYFRYSDIVTKTNQRLTGNNLSILERKLFRGNLHQQVETMARRTSSTERHLLELVARKPGEIQSIRNQLEAVVQGICDDAALQASDSGQIDGCEMMKMVVKELKEKAKEQPGNVYGESYECLIGMAGLLTEECTVWWSESFDLEEPVV